MSGFNLARKAKRTKREQLLQVEKCLTQKRQANLDYLTKHYLDDFVETKEYLEAKIQEFTIIIDRGMKTKQVENLVGV